MPSVDVENGVAVKRVEGAKGTGLVIGDARGVVHELFERGVEWVHIVDLDGAEKGKPMNMSVACYAARLGLRVQFGGGVRSLHVASLLDACGVERIVIGTLVFRNPREARRIVEALGGDRVVAALDAKYGLVAVEGWRRSGLTNVVDALEYVRNVGAKAIMYTCIECEGRLSGVNTELVLALRGRWDGILGYAGGVATRDDVRLLSSLGVDFAVLGMSHYMRLLDALEANIVASAR